MSAFFRENVVIFSKAFLTKTGTGAKYAHGSRVACLASVAIAIFIDRINLIELTAFQHS